MSDGYDLNPDGTALFEFEGVTRVLKRPTLGGYRAIIEQLGSLRDQVTKAQAEEKELPVDIQLGLLLDWIDFVFKRLAGEGLPRTKDEVIDEEVVPAWMLSSQVVSDLIALWQTVPSRHGGQ